MNKFLNFNRVLCLSPHPDDVEYGMLGSMIKFQDTNFELLCMTTGGKFDETVREFDRLDEVRKLWSQSGSTNFRLHFSNCEFIADKNEDEWINYIENLFIANDRYDAILLPSDLDSHFEHRLVSKFGYALSRSSPISIVEYATPSALQGWIPNFFVEIHDVLDKKQDLLKAMESQSKKMYFDPATIDGFHVDFKCMKRKLKKVEKFRIVDLYYF